MDLSRFLDRFRDAVADHRQAMEQCLQRLEQDPSREMDRSELARRLHTLKGEARMMGYEGLARLAHAAEDGLKATGGGPLPAELFLEAVDAFARLLEEGPEAAEPDLEERLRRPDLGEATGTGGQGAETDPPKPTGTDTLATDRFLGRFRETAHERLHLLGETLQHLARRPRDQEAVRRLLREVHTLKGEARMLGLADLASLVHHLEDFLKKLEQDEAFAERDGSGDLVFEMLDAVGELVDAHCDRREPELDAELLEATLREATDGKGGAPAPRNRDRGQDDPKQAGRAEAGEGRPRSTETIRVSVERLERLAGVTGDLLVHHSAREVRVEQLRGLAQRAKEIERALRQNPAARGLEDLAGTVRRLRAQAQDLLNREKAAFLETTLNLAELRGRIQEVRMVPVSTVFDFYPRIVRDLARQLDKDVRFHVEGRETELDRRILEAIRDPLVHLIRNALDHGIEPAAERVAAGKEARGRLRLAAAPQGDRILLTVEDDGRGMDPDRIRELAVEREVCSRQEADACDDGEALRLILEPGFSTAEKVTEISGRGVGMDVVARHVTRLGGSVDIRSAPGRGTTFLLGVPLSLALVRVLLVRAAGQVFALPSLEVTDVVRSRIREAEDGGRVVSREEEVVPITDLASHLGLSGVETWGAPPCILLEGPGGCAGFVVDDLVGEREVVVKGLGPYLQHPAPLSGATVLGDGSVALVLHPEELVRAFPFPKQARLASPSEKGGGIHGLPATGHRILVADDSLVIRDMMRGMLEGAGYHVELAVDGRDALRRLREGTFDLLVSDLQMPHVDGLDLTRSLRAEETLQRLPVIMVTTLAGEEDRAAGREAGVDAYLVKKELKAGEFLATVRRLLSRDGERADDALA